VENVNLRQVRDNTEEALKEGQRIMHLNK